MKSAPFVIGMLTVMSSYAQTTAAVGSLVMAVVDSQNRPIPSAQVTYRRAVLQAYSGKKLIPAAGEVTAAGRVLTDTSGTIAVTNLPIGGYSLCATVPSAPYLDPCVWRQPLRATVTSGAATKMTVTMERGVFLRVRVDDPAALLQGANSQWASQQIGVGITYGHGAYQGAGQSTSDSAGRSYQLIIPIDLPFQVHVSSTKVALADAAGNAISASVPTNVYQASAGVDQSFTFHVTGPSGKGK